MVSKSKCIDCGNFLIDRRSKRCKKCWAVNQTGDKNHYWRGGTPICQKCGKNTKGYTAKFCQKCHFKQWEVDETTHPRWSGNKPTYRAVHKWLYKRLGQPDTCELCEKTGLRGHSIHWASLSGKYRRDLLDWIRLCPKCHKIFDMSRLE